MLIDFELNGQEYIELNKLLKLLQLTETGGEANEAIVDGQVKVNGAVELQKRKKIRAGDKIVFRKLTVTVGK
jgi:ribosome-associated protein